MVKFFGSCSAAVKLQSVQFPEWCACTVSTDVVPCCGLKFSFNGGGGGGGGEKTGWCN